MAEYEQIKYILRYAIDRRCDYDECAKNYNDKYHAEFSKEDIENNVNQYFEEKVGISLENKCPDCGRELIGKKSKKMGYYVSCSNWIECGFYASQEYFFVSLEQRKKEKELLESIYQVPNEIWLCLGLWMELNPELFSFKESIFIQDRPYRTKPTYKQACWAKDILDRAFQNGFDPDKILASARS